MPVTKLRPLARKPDMTPLADELLGTMASIRRSGRLVASRPVELSALTGSQVDLVRLVRRRPGVSVTEAAAELRLAANTVSTLVGSSPTPACSSARPTVRIAASRGSS